MPILTTEEYLHHIDLKPKSVYVVHERVERLLPVHTHTKSQLTYVQGGIAYIYIDNTTYIIPARHYVWIPKGVPHFVKVRNAATVTRNLYYYTWDDNTDDFYTKLGIYPVNNLLFEMIGFTENWKGYIEKNDSEFNLRQPSKIFYPR